MLAVPPGSTIYVGDRGSRATGDIIKALNEWAGAIGMGTNLKTAEGCGNQYEITTVVDACEAAAMTSHWGVPGQWKLEYCGQGFTNSYDITLHEVGHMYGQCDRYAKGGLGHPIRGANCSDQGRGSDGNYNLPSAMQAGGPNHPQKVTEDDRNGLKALLSRNDIRGAARWREVLSAGNSGGTVPPVSGQNPPVNPPSPIPNANPGVTSGGSNNNGSNNSKPDSECSKFVNQIFRDCDSNGLCTFVQKAICGN